MNPNDAAFYDFNGELLDNDCFCPSNEELLKLAASNPPPKEWFDGEEECPFKVI
jgi:hypothetical protein